MIIDDRTEKHNLPLPYVGNDLTDDVNRIREAFNIIDGLDALPDQLGNTGKVLMTDGETASWQELPVSRNIAEIVTSLLPQKDAGLRLLDGSRLYGDGAYAGCVEYLDSIRREIPDYFITEEEFEESLSKYGSCGRFAYSQTMHTPGTEYIQVNLKCTRISTTQGYYFTYLELLDNPFKSNIYDSLDFQVNNGATSIPRDSEGNELIVDREYTALVKFDSWDGAFLISNLETLREANSYDPNTVEKYTQLLSRLEPDRQYYFIRYISYICSKEDFQQDKVNSDGYYVDSNGTAITESSVRPLVSTTSLDYMNVYTPDIVSCYRIPKVSDIFRGTSDVRAVGEMIEAGLPNIVGSFVEEVANPSEEGAGAFYISNLGTVNRATTSGSSRTWATVNFDASRSSTYYKDDVEKPTQQAIKALFYIVTATSHVTDIKVNINNVMTEVNNVMTDVSNVMNDVDNVMTDVDNVKASLSEKLDKSGGEMTGTIRSNTQIAIRTKFPLNLGDIPSANTCRTLIDVYSNDGEVRLGCVEQGITTDGVTSVNLVVRNKDNTGYHSLRVCSDGKLLFQSNNVLCENNFAASGYGGRLRLTNGLILQWGSVTASGSSATTTKATLPVAMADKSYVALAGYYASSDNMYGQVTARTTTQITMKTYGGRITPWFVIGRPA